MARPSTREKLLDSAERLFAEHGLEGVSLRSINAEAGLSPAALHYHFGCQRALVEALLERHMPALMERRRLLLDALDTASEPPTTRAVLSALLQPMAELLAEGGERGLRYLRLIERLQSDGDLDPQFVIERWPGGVDRLAPLLRAANPSLPQPLIGLRLGLSIGVLIRGLVDGRAPEGPALDAHVSALLDFVTGAFQAPVTDIGGEP
jgi:AcrR family transcriptional regulator